MFCEPAVQELGVVRHVILTLWPHNEKPHNDLAHNEQTTAYNEQTTPYNE